MTSMNHSPFPLLHIDLNEDQDQQVLFSPKPNEVSSSSSSTSAFSPNHVCDFPIFNNPNQDGGSYYYEGSNPFQTQQEANTIISLGGGSCENKTQVIHGNYGRVKLPIIKRKDALNGSGIGDEGTSSSKFVSTEKLMKKRVRSDRGNCVVPETSSFQTNYNQNKNNANDTTTVRVCSDCYTTKTPLWRSGPRGPKSLCNACGIRQRKARRAMAAAEAATANGSDFSSPITSKTKRPKRDKKASDSHLPFKKRSKFISQVGRDKRKLCFEDLSMIFSKKYSSFQQVFPQDEKEAAILLMALSYGLVRG